MLECRVIVYSEYKWRGTQFKVECDKHGRIGKYRNPDSAELSGRFHLIEKQWES